MPSVALASERARTELPPFSQAILDRYLDAHGRYIRGQPGGRRALVKYLQAPLLDFRGRQLAEADFTGANLERASLLKAGFERASFYCANLRGTDARHADFRQADFRGASLRGANLAGAKLDAADMRQAMLARADIDGGYHLWLQGDGADGEEMRFSVDLTNCSMKGVKLNSAKLKWANFSGAILHGADLSGADLTGAQFAGAVLTSARFDRLKIDPSAFDKCVLDPSQAALDRVPFLESLVNDNTRWVETNGKVGQPATLDGEDLRPLNALFAKRALTALSAKGCCAIGVDFSSAQLQGACFDRADLRDANFSSADLRGASFDGALLWHARFDDADIRPLALAGGSARDFSFKGAKFAAGCFQNSTR
ncbi:pentapeptide repeat-containing protein [Brevundimonas variabilis]|uniref:Uncharacterized protein YjbI with pentapeptide repeats n=1 Tax=Brevundimonas variabilis TaxID=74312 RepID=A0A7W9FEH6_9CAUL|nr:uncharacterized protein YjbI with pentapeptide repeats [Brevundimonas variabilis]